MRRMEEYNIVVKIEGLSEEEITTLYKDYLECCAISHSRGSIGDVVHEISINPFYSALAANILAPIVLNLGKDIWKRIKVSVKICDDVFENLTKDNLQKLNSFIQEKCKL